LRVEELIELLRIQPSTARIVIHCDAREEEIMAIHYDHGVVIFSAEEVNV